MSEWLTLQTFLRSALLPSAAVKIVFALSGAILALTAALVVTCFVKTYAMSFLGIPRSSWKSNGAEFARRPRFSLMLLAVACVLLGVLPTYVIPSLEPRRGTTGGSERNRFARSTVLYSYASEPATSASLPCGLS